LDSSSRIEDRVNEKLLKRRVIVMKVVT